MIQQLLKDLLDDDKGFKTRSSLSMLLLFLIFTTPILLLLSAKFECLDSATMGQIGDTIGGTTAPLVGLIAAFLTFAAFYVQYQANQEQKKQFLKQSFENHFFELLKMYNDFGKEMEIVFSEKPIKGREVFEYLLIDLRDQINGFHGFHANITHLQKTKKIYSFGFYENVKSVKKQELLPGWNVSTDGKQLSFKNNYYTKFRHLNKNLDQYFRVLFNIINYIVEYESNILTEKEKYKYIKILRTQISPQEQELFLIHTISIWGRKDFINKWRITKNIRKFVLEGNHALGLDIQELYKDLGVSPEGKYISKDEFNGQYIFQFAEDEVKQDTNYDPN